MQLKAKDQNSLRKSMLIYMENQTTSVKLKQWTFEGGKAHNKLQQNFFLKEE